MEHDLIVDNPKLKGPILEILGILAQGSVQERRDVELSASERWNATFVRNPSQTIDILVKRGAVKQEVLVNGEPYGGTLEDIQLDESVPDDAEVKSVLTATQRGLDLLEAHEPKNALLSLLDERPRYADVFQAVLWACSSETGCGRAELERQIEEATDMVGKTDGTGRIYPQYFIDALESAGGIAWDGAWHTTQAGLNIVEGAA